MALYRCGLFNLVLKISLVWITCKRRHGEAKGAAQPSRIAQTDGVHHNRPVRGIIAQTSQHYRCHCDAQYCQRYSNYFGDGANGASTALFGVRAPGTAGRSTVSNLYDKTLPHHRGDASLTSASKHVVPTSVSGSHDHPLSRQIIDTASSL
jgi:hypothetical protein